MARRKVRTLVSQYLAQLRVGQYVQGSAAHYDLCRPTSRETEHRRRLVIKNNNIWLWMRQAHEAQQVLLPPYLCMFAPPSGNRGQKQRSHESKRHDTACSRKESALLGHSLLSEEDGARVHDLPEHARLRYRVRCQRDATPDD